MYLALLKFLQTMLRPGSVRKAQVAVIPQTILCSEHQEKVNFFCTNCDDLVCNECVVGVHNGHKFRRISDIVSEKRNEVRTKLDGLEKGTVPEIKRLLDVTRQQRDHNKCLSISINKKADELIRDVNKARNDLLQEINESQTQENGQILEEILSEVEQTVVDYGNDIQSSKDARIVKINLELTTKITEIEKVIREIRNIKQRVFIPGNTGSVRDILGRLVEEAETTKGASIGRNVSNHVIETKLEVVSEFQHETDKGSIYAITTDNNNSAWIASYDGREVKRVDSDGRNKQTLTFTIDINDLVITDDGCLLVTPNGGSGDHKYQIKKVKRNEEIVTFIDTKPLRPHCICTSPTGHLYVGCGDGYNYDVTDKNTRSVIKLSRDGVKLKTWQFDERHKRMFTSPQKLQTNNKDMIWVYDRTATAKGRVVVLHDQEDGVRFIYNGIKNDKITRDLNPCDLTTAADGTTMLICDTNNHIIHGVDENGSLLYYIGSQCQSGLGAVSAICLNKKGNELWAGYLKGRIQVLKLSS